MNEAPKAPKPRTAIRLAAAFVVILGLFACALVVTLITLARLEHADTEVAQLDEAKHTGHNVAGLIRELYIHQAHTIIEWNRSHLAHYEQVSLAVRQATKRLQGVRLLAEERAQADEVVRLVAAVDDNFRTRILPKLDLNDREAVQVSHREAEALVTQVVRLSERLNMSLEDRASAALVAAAHLRRRARQFVIACFSLAILVTVVVGFATGRSILIRLNNLRAGALRIAAGDLETRIPAQGSDEFAELAHRFNEMATAIVSQQRKLVESQRLAVLGQLSAGVAHEINNPLGVILGYVKLLRPRTAEPKLQEGLRIIEDEAHQCQRIVEGLLGLARPAAMNREAVDLNLIASGAIERLKEANKVAQRRIELVNRYRNARVEADAAAVRQVVSNLLLNAIDATGDCGSITVEFGGDDDSIEMAISDDGCGMSADVLDRAFEPFFSAKPTGTGLGLAISQTIVATHGGTLTLQPNAGGGTRAVMRLPRCLPQIRESA